jgi:predicted nucleic acid-binding protein
VIVVDASIVANALADDSDDGQAAREALRAGVDLVAPDLVDIETVAVLRKRWLAKTLTARRFRESIDDLGDLAIIRYPALPLMPRAFELRANVTVYDSTYVALAEALDVPLMTGDKRLANATGPACEIRLVSTS